MNRATLLDRRLRELHANRVELVRPIEELARIFRALQAFEESRAGFKHPVKVNALSALYKPAQTFEAFLKINRLPEYEAVLR